MGNVEIPEWLKGLPLAPEFHPTDTEFADPIAYISKIEKEASVFGICKVIPPVPKPSKRYVFGNLSKSLLRSSELGSLESSSDGSGSSSKSVSGVKGGDGDIRAVFTTRQQELGRSGKRVRGLGDAFPPVAQKQVWQSGEVYTLEQFELKSKAFSRSVLSTVKDVSPFVIEALFWKAASEKPIYVEYANDVPGSAFGESEGQLRYLYGHKRRRRRVFARNNQGRSYGVKQEVTTERNHCNGTEMDFSSPHLVSVSEPSGECTTEPPTSFSSETLKSTKPRGLCSNSEMEGTSGWKLSNSPWNLQVIAHSAGSLTRFMLDDIPGVTSPMVYIGMLFSWFAWHVEDHELHSLNFLHTGSPKTWYAVPGDSAFAFEEVIRNHAYGGDIDRLAALASLGEKTTLLSPEIVLASGIPCCRLVQNPGEFVVTFPRAYHVGFSHGFNCGEAANFGTPQWLKIAREAAVRRAAMDHLPMLSHQQLLYLLTMSFVSRVPRSLLPGVRSSRLKDRQREERELLVKKAFIEDMLKENTLLNILLSKDPTFRAVLWDPNSLPLFNKDSSQQTGTVPNATVLQENDHKIDLSEELSFNMETASYLDDDDLCSDYQVDSGLVACVACGILGYPFMSVIQPSKDAAMEIWPMDMVVETLEPANSKLTDYCDAKEGSVLAMLTKIDERWNSTSGFLRPCIFCLEHAVQVEELLRPKGGANVLVICHSDYQKIKANAAVVAEEIKMAFNYKEVTLDSASQQDLNLINLAIDAAERETSEQDWTSKLSINLRHCIKSRKGSLAKQIEHALKLAGLFSDATQGSNIAPVNWSSRRCRSKLKKNDVKEGKSGDSCQLKKNDVTVGKACDGNQFKSNGSSGRKDSVLLQYSRRKFKNKQETVEANRNVMTAVVSEAERTSEMGFESCTLASDCTEPHSVEVFDCFDSDKLENNANLRHTEDPPMPCTDPENRSTLPLVIENPGLKNINGADGMETDEKFSSSESMKEKLEYVEPKSGERSKRKREIALLSEDELNQNGFARSPCEGLRPRNRIDITLVSEEQQSTQKVKESVACSDEDASFRCDIEDCKMRFKTRVELSLHKRNRCPHEQCGKRFRSHKYAVLHQRVHIKDRPLKCTWEGCTMTFKWAWARTEHLRLHTGERPYQCKIEGCGLTFRFVSDFSRHRRKTGHYVNPPSS